MSFCLLFPTYLSSEPDDRPGVGAGRGHRGDRAGADVAAGRV